MQDLLSDRYNILFNMENAEDVMQLLEEFSKVKPKDIPRELDEYLGYVAKTGDPVFQWSLIKNLLREKLLVVVTDFYESTLTVELPPCPNVEPFNYERMKTSLLERFDAFSGAPFTIQRICELLINPRKEYNRADKYMRAIEKNILVVSTREPGTGKRPLECDQSESILNGMPDAKISESDGSLLHVPTDLPYFGAPPASNDVIIETTEPNSTDLDRARLGINGDVNDESDQLHSLQESSSSVVAQESQVSPKVDLKHNDVPLDTEVKKIKVEESDCDSNTDGNTLPNLTETIDPSSDTELDVGPSVKEIKVEKNDSVLPDCIDSSDSPKEFVESNQAVNIDSTDVEELGMGLSDENEVSSSPADQLGEAANIQEECKGATDSEAEAADSCLGQEIEATFSPDSDSNSNEKVNLEVESQISITEITASKEEVDLECNEISGTVISPVSPENAQQTDEVVENRINVDIIEDSEKSNLHPDSSDDLCFQSTHSTNETQKQEIDLGQEADSASEEKLDQSSEPNEEKIGTSDHILTVEEVKDDVGLLSSSKLSEEALAKIVDGPSIGSPVPIVDSVISEGPSSSQSKEDSPTIIVEQPDVESTSDVAVDMYENERRDESVIQPIPHIAQEQITIEEINVDPNCDADEAMDVDDCSNQMMVSEGENEGEPMDEGDQLQS